MESVKLGLIQMKCTHNIKENFDQTVDFIHQAAERGANIVCTQELFQSQYFCQVEDKNNMVWQKNLTHTIHL